jgi:Protein of unknown function (DUF2905)
MGRDVGLVVMLVGAVLIVVGMVIFSGLFGWFGRLPGDIRIDNEDTRVFIPITSMLIVSAALSVVIALLRRLF